MASGNGAAVIAAGLIVLFVTGVMLGTLTGHFLRAHRAAGVLVLVTFLLGLAALLGDVDDPRAAVIAMTLAMGAENAVFERGGEVHIGLTYMTGTLVKLGQHLTRALLGGPRWSWTPYLLLWLGLASGALAGALAWPHLGLNNLWLAAGVAAVFAAIAWRVGPAMLQSGALE